MKNINQEDYQALVKSTCPRSSHTRTMILAFVVGGIICMIGQGFFDLYKAVIPTFSKEEIATLTSMTMIFLGAFLTGLGMYDKLGYYAGGGSIIPITGFANSIVSPAMEFRKEGVVFGTMCKMFVVAGPIIVSGIAVSVLVGIIYYVIGVAA